LYIIVTIRKAKYHNLLLGVLSYQLSFE